MRSYSEAMDLPPPTMDASMYDAPLRRQLDAFLDDHRQLLLECIDGLTEEQARRRLVPSRTTLLALLKHATFVERVWFDEAVTGRPRSEIGIPQEQSDSFDVADTDTVASVSAEFAAACDDSRGAVAALGLDDVVTGNRRGPLPLRWVMLHMLREHAQHCGHAEILREQVLAQDA
jgi:hypothetical protein